MKFQWIFSHHWSGRSKHTLIFAKRRRRDVLIRQDRHCMRLAVIGWGKMGHLPYWLKMPQLMLLLQVRLLGAHLGRPKAKRAWGTFWATGLLCKEIFAIWKHIRTKMGLPTNGSYRGRPRFSLLVCMTPQWRKFFLGSNLLLYRFRLILIPHNREPVLSTFPSQHIMKRTNSLL